MCARAWHLSLIHIYTLYAYTNAKEYIVLTSGGKTLVIGMDDEARTQAIYETLLEKTGKR